MLHTTVGAGMALEAPQQQQTVLVIDDDPIVVDILETVFDGDLRIVTASSGPEGIDKACAEKPDLILLDVRMPDIDGYDTCRQLKSMAETADIPLVFLTARIETDDEFKGLELGAIDYIAKPIIPQIVRVRIQNHLLMKRQRDQLANMSMIDGLTGIANRRRFDDHMDQELRRAVRTKQPFSLLLMDIDDFKAYNDTYGHARGDDCLRTVAQAIGGHLRRPTDLVARYGGEEFAVVLPDTPLEHAYGLAEKIRLGIVALNIPHAKARAASHVTVSVGAATSTSETPLTKPQLIEAADAQLYASKRAGRNRVSRAA
jgi:diguanylate cyclase (GGDEF)-like protein